MEKHNGTVQIPLERYLELYEREKKAFLLKDVFRNHMAMIYNHIVVSLRNDDRLPLQVNWEINIDSMNVSKHCTGIKIINNVINFTYDGKE